MLVIEDRNCLFSTNSMLFKKKSLMLTVFEVVNQNLSLKTNYIERIRGSQWVHQQIFYHYHRKALQPVNVKVQV